MKLDVGLIGPGPDWEAAYRPALARLAHRLRVRAVYAAVGSRAAQIAAEFGGEAETGMLQLFERSDLRGVLVLDGAWFDGIPAGFACRNQKPAFLATSLSGLDRALALRARAADSGVTLMPDFGHRYTASTSRLRELTATKLGRPIEVRVEVARRGAPDATGVHLSIAAGDPLLCAFDWCTNLVGTSPQELTLERRDSDRCIVGVQFKAPAAGGEPAKARIEVGRAEGAREPVSSAAGSLDFRAEVHCAGGKARIDGARQILWSTSHDIGKETLTSDRPEADVLLDHFSRRAAGGLIPVPTIDDACRGLALCRLVEHSSCPGQRTLLKPVWSDLFPAT